MKIYWVQSGRSSSLCVGTDVLMSEAVRLVVPVFAAEYFYDTREMWILDVRVPRHMRGRGIATAVFTNLLCLSVMLGARVIKLNASGDGKRFWPRRGFVPDPERPHENSNVMVYPLERD